MIEIILQGKPRALKRHRPSARGGYYDPSSKDKKQMWLQIAKFKPKAPLTGDIMVKLLFVMPRPKHHFRTGKFKHLLKSKFENIYWHRTKPDADNLVKLVLDVIQGKDRFIVDDSQVCRLQAEKVYGKTPRTEIIIEEI